MGMERVIDTAVGNLPADLLLKNAAVVNVFSGEILKTDVAVKDGLIAGVGEYDQGYEILDLEGKYLIPGLIDAHIHLESSMLTPEGFAAAVVPHGTTAVIADPHEIVNVAGLAGLRYMVEASQGLPLDIFYMIPSCIPATPMETAGAVMGPAEIEEAWDICPQSPGLAELMNFPGVLFKTEEVLAKAKVAVERDRLIDGHAPLLSGTGLSAYLSVGVSTDHESTTLEEAREKLRLGAKIIIREGSAAKNLSALLPMVNEKNYPNLMFGCDDRHPEDLMIEGEMDHILRLAVAAGLDPVTAVRMATINPARHYRLAGRGGIAPGYRADMVVVGDLSGFRVEKVFKSGKLVAQDGKTLASLPSVISPEVRGTVRLPDLEGRLELPPSPAANASARVIQVFPDQILTGSVMIPADQVPQTEGVLRVAVVERHGRNGNVGLGLVTGFGPMRGTLASTVAHDSHNFILVGSDTRDMEMAARVMAELGGGLAVVAEGRVLATLALPVAGLMSDREVETVADNYNRMLAAAKEIGCLLPSPFMTMSFMALPVIPQLKITDRGLIDVNRFTPVDLWTQADS